ncbi:MAG: hypothetical protein ACRD2L_10125, partial [Terriglobia bacterium]
MSMVQEARLEGVHYMPTFAERRKYLLKKGLSLLGLGLISGFVIWLFWPGITGPPALLDLGYWTFLVSLFLAFVALGFLVVVTWNERLPRIADGNVALPFPIRRTNRLRTGQIRIEEMVSVELTTNSIGRAGAEIRLRDGTRLFLPNSVFGNSGKDILET